MNMVVDTSVIIAVIANEPEKAAILLRTQGTYLFAPKSIHWEIGNAFSAMLKRRRITVDQATAAIKIYERIPLNLMEIELSQAVKLASQFSIYAYDAYVIACAINQNCPLLSLDSGLIRAAKTANVNALEILPNANLP